MKKYHLTHIQNLALIEVGLMHNITDILGFPKGVITPEHLPKFKEALDTHEVHLKYLRLKHSRKYLNAIRNKLSRDGYTYEEYEQDVKVLQEWEESELDDVVFGFIPADHAPYFENKELFGKEVNDSFPSAIKDIEEAGNCYAHGSYTACVFHLMRAVEHGARAMVKGLRVQKNLKHKLELCEWGDLIKALDDGLKPLAVGKRKSLKVTENFEFYNHALAQFRNFKDAWRNNVSHSGKVYPPGEAKDVMDNTRQFMQHLATRIKG